LTGKQGKQSLEKLITRSRVYYEELSHSLQRGRDRLLEYNSCRPDIASDIKRRAADADDARMIADYMEDVFDCIGIDNEIHSEGCLLVTPTEHMSYHLPGLTEEGMTITYERNIALTFEDAHYITWEHPFTSSIIDIVLSNEIGNTSVTAAEYAGVEAGSVLMECLFSVESAPIEELQSERYLPPTMIRVVCDERGVDHDIKLPHHDIRNKQKVDIAVANKIVKAKRKILKAMLQRSEKYAELKADKILAIAHKKSEEILQIEINRLNALSKVNPNIRADEINYFERQLSRLNELIDSANIRLDAIRVIVAM
jgi:ATP-dependent helicase HepA